MRRRSGVCGEESIYLNLNMNMNLYLNLNMYLYMLTLLNAVSFAEGCSTLLRGVQQCSAVIGNKKPGPAELLPDSVFMIGYVLIRP